MMESIKLKLLLKRASTSPSLLGIPRSISKKDKYHLSLIWIGVIIGFVLMKLSGSFNKYGYWNINMKIKINKKINVI